MAIDLEESMEMGVSPATQYNEAFAIKSEESLNITFTKIMSILEEDKHLHENKTINENVQKWLDFLCSYPLYGKEI